METLTLRQVVFGISSIYLVIYSIHKLTVLCQPLISRARNDADTDSDRLESIVQLGFKSSKYFPDLWIDFGLSFSTHEMTQDLIESGLNAHN